MNVVRDKIDTNVRVAAMPKWFSVSAGLTLGLIGVAKVWAALGNSELLVVAEPILGFQFGHLMLAVGVAELIVAWLCLFGNRQMVAIILVAWLGTNFLVYRLGLWWIGWRKPCGCLGSLTDSLHLSPQVADSIVKALLTYLLVGSYGLLCLRWVRARREP